MDTVAKLFGSQKNKYNRHICGQVVYMDSLLPLAANHMIIDKALITWPLLKGLEDRHLGRAN